MCSSDLPKFRGSEATVAVPVHIFLGSLDINVFALFHIKPTVIVPGVIGSMLAGSSVVPCQFQFSSLQSLLIFPEGEAAAQPPNLRISASGNNPVRVDARHQLFLGKAFHP